MSKESLKTDGVGEKTVITIESIGIGLVVTVKHEGTFDAEDPTLAQALGVRAVQKIRETISEAVEELRKEKSPVTPNTTH